MPGKAIIGNRNLNPFGAVGVQAMANDVMKRKQYEHELRRLQTGLCKLQEWVKYKGLRIMIVFEGRDAAGKGGTIKAITERVSPRVFRVAALPAPSDREKSQMYLQRYVPHFPAGGEIVIFDRSWYNRAGVERVMGFCTEEQHNRFLRTVPFVERSASEDGIFLVKYWLEVGKEEQERRIAARLDGSPAAMEAEPDGCRFMVSLGGLHAGEGRDVHGHRYSGGSLVHHPFRR